jgi:hypothetical protein
MEQTYIHKSSFKKDLNYFLKWICKYLVPTINLQNLISKWNCLTIQANKAFSCAASMKTMLWSSIICFQFNSMQWQSILKKRLFHVFYLKPNADKCIERSTLLEVLCETSYWACVNFTQKSVFCFLVKLGHFTEITHFFSHAKFYF